MTKTNGTLHNSHLQHTLKSEVSFEGSGLLTGKKCKLRLLPANANSGYTLIRTDLSGSRDKIKISPQNIKQSVSCLSVSNQADISVLSLDRILPALIYSGIDNCLLILDGGEIPIMDGSAEPFMSEIKATGKIAQRAERNILLIKRPVVVCDGNRKASLLPNTSAIGSIEYQSRYFDQNFFSTPLNESSFSQQLARSRHFGFVDNYGVLKNLSFAKGGSLKNSVLIDRFGVINPDGLRTPDEFIRDKLLTALGDLALIGYRFHGEFFGRQSHHRLHYQLISELFSSSSHYEFVPESEVPLVYPLHTTVNTGHYEHRNVF